MDMTQLRFRYPIDAITELLNTRRLSRATYLRGKESLTAWQKQAYGRTYSLTLSDQERANMEFVDYQLTSDEQSAAEQWMYSDDMDFLGLIDQVVKSGYRISYTMDTKNRCVTVTIIARGSDTENTGRAMATRHSTVQAALQMALYKHVVIFEQGSWGETGPEALYG